MADNGAWKAIAEGKAQIAVPVAAKVSKEMEVFYNPVMKTNRDVSLAVLRALGKRFRCLDLMAGTGVRSIRMLLETDCVEHITINDYDASAVKLIKENLAANGLAGDTRVTVTQQDANLLMLEGKGWDYIDVDPFGTPNPYLDAAVRRLSRDSILAITATDTAPLCGTYANACKRKYWAVPLRNELQHEAGLRILIRKAQLIGAQYEKALTPLYSFSVDHYLRVFFRCEKSKETCDLIQKQHQFLRYCGTCMYRDTSQTNSGLCPQGHSLVAAGPLWIGDLWEEKLADRIAEQNKEDKLAGFYTTIAAEARMHTIGFYELHEVCPRHKMPMIRSEEAALLAAGSRTHFSGTGIRATQDIYKFVDALADGNGKK